MVANAPLPACWRADRARPAPDVPLHGNAMFLAQLQQEPHQPPVANGPAVHHVHAGPFAHVGRRVVRVGYGAAAYAPVQGDADVRLYGKCRRPHAPYAHFLLDGAHGVDVNFDGADGADRLQEENVPIRSSKLRPMTTLSLSRTSP